jgi:translation elongation factor EF-G
MDQTQTFDTTEWLTFKLTEKEKIEKGEELVEFKNKLDRANAELANIKKKLGGEIKVLETELDAVFSILNAGEEARKVECKKEINYTTETTSFYFKGELMKERKIDYEERQTQLKLVSPPPASAMASEVDAQNAGNYSAKEEVSKLTDAFGDI